jgi:hypothetical protein
VINIALICSWQNIDLEKRDTVTALQGIENEV